MRLLQWFTAVTLGLSGGIGGAQAAPPAPVQKSPTIIHVPDWTGVYLGGQMGVEFHTANYNSLNFIAPTKVGDVGGTARGFYAGFNYQLSIPFVVGIEGSITRLKGDGPKGGFQLAGADFDPLLGASRISTLTGRLGYLLTPGTLVYGKGGVARIKVHGFDNFTDPFEKTLAATVWGVGIESMVTENVLVRVEATRTRANTELKLNNGFDVYRPDFFQVMAGAALKINPGIPSGAEAPAPSWFPRREQINRTWTTVFVGGDLGGAGGRVKRTDPSWPNTASFTDVSMMHSLYFGADWQIPRFGFLPDVVIGVQYSKSWMNLNFDDPTGVSVGTDTIFRFASISRLTAVTGRVGVLLNPATMVYLRAGPAHVTFQASPNFFNATNPASRAATTTRTGSQVGFGAETWVTDHLALRAEALFTKTRDSVVLDGIAPADTELKPSVTSGTMGLLAKF
jgi:opacity protein-like surface antigen